VTRKKEKSQQKWWGLIILALVLRLIVGSLFYHTDTKAIYRDAGYIKTGVINGYLTAEENESSLPYPPATYLMFNTHEKLGKIFFSNHFETWMNDWGAEQTNNHPSIFRDLWAMKLPMLIADGVVAWLIYVIVKKRKFEAVSLWLLNPFSLYSIYAIGQFDIIPTALMLAGLYLWREDKKHPAYMAVAAGAGFKLFPLMMLPVMWLSDERKIKEKIVSAGLAGATLAVMLSPVIKSVAVMKSIFLSNLTSGAFEAVIDIGKGESLPIYMLIYVSLLLWLWLKKNKKKDWALEVVTVYGLLFGLSHFHPQWMTWMMPFLVILLIEERISWKTTSWLMLAYLATVLLIDDKFVGLGLLKAVNNAFDTLPTIRWGADRLLLGEKLQMVAHAGVLAGVIAMLREKKPSLKKIDINLTKIAIGWFGSLIAVFCLAHLPLTIWGRYIDTNKMNPQEVMALTDKTVFKERLEVSNNYLIGVELRLKNVNLANQTDLIVRLTDGQENIVEEKVINGRQIGDDFDLKVMWDSPKDVNSQEEWWLEISSPQAPTDDEFKLGVINKDELAYVTYFNPGGWKENLVYSLKNIVAKL